MAASTELATIGREQEEVSLLLSSGRVTIESSPRRFRVIGLFVLVSMLGGYSIDLLQSAEATAVMAFPGLDPHMLSTIQLATQIPAMLLEPLALQQLGMRRMTILAAALQLIGYVLMGGVPFVYDNQQAALLYLGNACVGFTAGLLLIPVGTICSSWLPDAERSTYLSLCLNAGNIGTGMGFFLCSVVNSNPADLRSA